MAARRVPPPAAAARRGEGPGRKSSRYAERISDDLRRGDGPVLARRRRSAVPLLGASAAILPWAARDPAAAAHLAATGATLTLVGMGPADRAGEAPWIPLATVAALAAHGVASAALALRRPAPLHAVAGAAALAAIAPSLPEARAAARAYRTRRSAARTSGTAGATDASVSPVTARQ
jgi:hypothetical protein